MADHLMCQRAEYTPLNSKTCGYVEVIAGQSRIPTVLSLPSSKKNLIETCSLGNEQAPKALIEDRGQATRAPISIYNSCSLLGGLSLHDERLIASHNRFPLLSSSLSETLAIIDSSCWKVDTMMWIVTTA